MLLDTVNVWVKAEVPVLHNINSFNFIKLLCSRVWCSTVGQMQINNYFVQIKHTRQCGSFSAQM